MGRLSQSAHASAYAYHVNEDSDLRAFTVVRQAPTPASPASDAAALKEHMGSASNISDIPKPWGADVVDGSRNSRACTPSLTNLGHGVNVYVLDAGCAPKRGGLCATMIASGVDADSCDDLNGHGNHVASTACDESLGVAPRATVHCLKVLDKNGDGSDATVIRGIGRAVEHFGSSPGKGGVLNLSLGGVATPGGRRALESAIHKAAVAGLYVTLAAGNGDVDACGISPARTARGNGRIFTVESHNQQKESSDFSNYGECTDISAPGEAILSKTGAGKVGLYSGTSQAVPHVTGAAAILLSDGKAVSSESLAQGGEFTNKGGFQTPILEIKC